MSPTDSWLPRALPRRNLCTVSITFIEDGEEIQVEAQVGKTILEVAHANEIDLEGTKKNRRAPAAAAAHSSGGVHLLTQVLATGRWPARRAT